MMHDAKSKKEVALIKKLVKRESRCTFIFHLSPYHFGYNDAKFTPRHDDFTQWVQKLCLCGIYMLQYNDLKKMNSPCFFFKKKKKK
mmetsp:Transcript_29542/g.43201  ORF Transcript_29542/g.43201 Transcript_29542/m.43201 type:complete len:86 (+) Transcript_29542:906-1163(+)